MAGDARAPVGPAPVRKRFDVFVSFAEEDREWVNGFLLPALIASHVRCCTMADFPAGLPLLEALAQAIENSERVVLVVSPAYMADHIQQVAGPLSQHFGAERRTWPVVPVLLQPSELPLSLRMLTPVSAVVEEQWIPAVERLCRELGRPLEADVPIACPYPGILPYDEDPDTPFFGREAEIEAATRHLDLNPWLFVIGASGCGKSSLAHAGIVPSVGKRGFEAVRMRPGAEPLAALQVARDKLAEAVAKDRRPLLVVDQLEEIFADHAAGSARSGPFLSGLQTLVTRREAQVLATVRADFYPQLMETVLWPILREHRMELVPLSGEQLRKAVAEPAAGIGVVLQTSLLDRLVAESDRQPGSLPFLQETLVMLWPKRNYRFLPLSAYESFVSLAGEVWGSPRSGLEAAMATRADALVRGLPSEAASRIAQRILLRLVQFGDGREDVRRQQTRDSLRSVDDDPAVFDATMVSLVKGHLLTVTSSDISAVIKVDLSHEALIRGWPKLRQWIDQRRTAEITRRELEAAAANWTRMGQNHGGLLDDVELREAERWRSSAEASQLGLSQPVDQLLAASRLALEKARVRRRRTEVGLRALSVALVLFLVTTLALALTAQTQRDRAIAERATAQSGELALTAAALPETQLDRSLLLAREAVQLRETPRSLGSTLSGLRANPRLLRMIHFGGALSAVAASPDGRTIGVGDVNGQVRLIDATTGDSPGPATSIAGQVHGLAFSPDGELVVASGSGGTVQQWRAADGSAVGSPLDGHDGSVRAVSYSPDGRWIATGGIDRRVILHPRGAGLPRILSNHRDWVNSLAFTSDSRYLVSAGGRTEHKSADGRVLVWDVQSGRQVRALPDQGDAVRGVAVSADGTLATAGADGQVRLWKLADGSGGAIVSRHKDRAYGVTFVDDGRVVASASRDGQVLLVRRDGKPSGSPLLGHGAAVRSVAALSEDRLATVGFDARLLIWDIRGRKVPARLARLLDAPDRPVRAVAVDPAGSLVATGNDDGMVTMRRAADLQVIGPTIRTGPHPVWGLALGPDGTLVTTSSTGALEVWDARTGQSRAGPVNTGALAAVVAISADGKLIATGGQNDAVQLWDLKLAKVGRPLPGHLRPIVALSFRSSDGALISAGYDGLLWLWTGVGGDANVPPVGRRLAASSAALTSLSLSPNGETAVTGDLDGNLLFWDTAAVGAARPGRPMLVGHSAPVSAVQHTPDGRYLVSADESGVVRLWDLSAGPREVGELGRGDPVRVGSVLPGQRRFLVGIDSGLSAWVLDPAEWATTACDLAGRNLRPPEQLDYLDRRSYVATCPALPPPPDPAPAPTTDGP